MKTESKRRLALLLALALCLSLCACGSGRDTSGIGTIDLNEGDGGEDDDGGIGTLGGGGSSPSPGETATPTSPTGPSAPSGLSTEVYDDEYFTMTIPDGWTVQSYASDTGMLAVKVYDPSDTDFCIMYYGVYEPLFPSEESRQTWSGQADSRYGYAPVVTEPTAEQMLLHWAECAALVTAMELPVSFPALGAVTILDAGTYEGNYKEYGATESEAVAACVRDNGTACGVYLSTAMILTDPQAIEGTDTRYYSSYHNYMVMAPQESWETCYETLSACVLSLTPKRAASSGFTAPKPSAGDTRLPAIG